MKFLKVLLHGSELGRLAWDESRRCSYFMFNPELDRLRPDVSPLLLPKGKHNPALPAYGDSRHIYQGLPPFIADSLPDAWGNALFERWVKDNHMARHQVTPLHKLMFIGKRGMGALEYEPSAHELEHIHRVDVNALHRLSLKVLSDRESVTIDASEHLTMQSLLAVGTSAGGRQMKAIIAINRETGEFRSGQTDGLSGYDYCLLKFGNSEMPLTEIEMAYHEMARAAGIEMESCRLLAIDGVNHFVTTRFDRKDGRKLHVQTLAAINPEAVSYEEIVATCRALHLPEREVEELFRRLVFNVMANNTDDHNKNFSFIMDSSGAWHLSPAYDITFIFNHYGTGPQEQRCMSIGGKTSGVTRDDIMEFARENGIRNASAVIRQTGAALMRFQELATRHGISTRWSSIIARTLTDTLSSFGLTEQAGNAAEALTDSHGRRISHMEIKPNSKGHYEVRATIDGVSLRRFIRPNMPLYHTVNSSQGLNAGAWLRIVEELFAPRS